MTPTFEERVQARIQRNQWEQAAADERAVDEREAAAKAAGYAEVARTFNGAVAVARAAEVLNVPLFAERDAIDGEIGKLAARRAVINAEIVARRNEVLPDALNKGRALGEEDGLRILDGRPIERADITGDDDAAKWARFFAALIGNGHIWIGDDGRGWVQCGTRQAGYQL